MNVLETGHCTLRTPPGLRTRCPQQLCDGGALAELLNCCQAWAGGWGVEEEEGSENIPLGTAAKPQTG